MVREINDTDIKEAEKALLPDGESLIDEKQERVKVIKHLDTADIKACPGSGKTTALIAKLMILAKQMPFPDGRGVCVLTHTNVAIDEIKDKLGSKSDVLFGYPNHFGTFQSFVDRFLAIPAYCNKNGYRPNRIGNDEYFNRIDQQRKYLGKKGNHFCLKNGRKGYPYSIVWEDFTLNDNKCGALNLDLAKEDDKLIYDRLARMKKSIFKDGYLSYDDTYKLAFWYISKYPRIKEAFSKRFRYVFIDEMQDTDHHQQKVINGIFDQSVAIQRIGDPHQSIYNKVRAEQLWEPDQSALPISESKRFGENIAKILRTVCIENNSQLKANDTVNSYQPRIILFDDNTVKNVIGRFARLVHDNGLVEIAKKIDKPIKAIGWVGTSKDDDAKLTINSYFKDYNSKIKRNVLEFNSLKYFVRKQRNIKKVKGYKDAILIAFTHILSLLEKKNDLSKYPRNFTPASLVWYLKEKSPVHHSQLLEKLAVWSYDIHTSEEEFNQEVLADITKFLVDVLYPYFDIQNQGDVKKFVENTEIGISEEEVESANVFETKELPELKIEVGTIHSAKGETHTATLYLETFYYKHESEKLMPFLKGTHNNNSAQQKTINEALKMAYVGMSRPKFLLCFAAHKDRISGHEQELESAGWCIDNHLVTAQ